MTEPADTQYPIHHPLERRWSPRAFSDRAIEPDTLRSLFEAARWAPSSYNEQPWHFFVALKDNEDEFNRILSCLAEGNLKWAQSAPVLMISVAKLHFDKNDKFNRHAFHDVGLAVQNLIVQATTKQLFVHQMAGFDVEKAIKLFEIPEGHEPVAVIAAGYLDEDEADSKDRTRRPFGEFVFESKFGKPSKLFS